jgi:tRNA (cytidine/uridine-2'-O-)-methyltransferase
MRITLYQPDIPQNTGTILRMAACFGIGVDIIEPCGFLLDDRRLRRSGMDYLESVDMKRHASWAAFRSDTGGGGRLILLTTKGATRHCDFAFAESDRLLFGRESAGVPDEVAAEAHARIRIPMTPGQRSLNVAVAAAIVLGEALRQTGFPP